MNISVEGLPSHLEMIFREIPRARGIKANEQRVEVVAVGGGGKINSESRGFFVVGADPKYNIRYEHDQIPSGDADPGRRRLLNDSLFQRVLY